MPKFIPSKKSVLKVMLTLGILTVFVFAYLDAWVKEKIDEKSFSEPSIVYARALEVFNGKVIRQSTLIQQLRLAGYQSSQKAVPQSFNVQGNKVRVITPQFAWWDGIKPQHTVRLQFNGSGSRVIDVRSKLQKGYARFLPIEIGRLHPQLNEDRLKVPLNDVPDAIIDALIATEDRDFYQHFGLSLKGIARAAWQNVNAGRVVQGGSTITQQLAKNFFLNSDRSLSRKAIEAVMAILLEFHADKDTILEAYINEVFVAQDGARAIHGFGLASQYLFAKNINELNIAQSALLVGMLKGPSFYNPIRNPKRALTRRNLVISLLEQQDKITENQAITARSKPLELSVKSDLRQSSPAYLDLVRRQLKRDYSHKDLTSKGLRIFTHLDPIWQQRAQKALQRGVDNIRDTRNKQQHYKLSQLNGAVIVVDPHLSDVLALVGGKNPRAAGFNRSLDAHRQIGSLVKPAVTLTAMEQGYGLNNLISDAPLSISTRQGTWEPQNFNRQFNGDVSINKALAKSYNVATARLANDMGIGLLVNTLQQLGIEESIQSNPSLSLGAIDLSPFQVAQMYSTIAADGFYSPLKSIREITTRNGKPLNRYKLHIERRFDAAAIHQTQFALQSVMHEGTGKSVKRFFRENTVLAGKTGTSSDQRDSWFAGFNNKHLSIVWLGTDDNQKLPVTGGSGALPIWAEIMSKDVSALGNKRIPNSLEYLWIDDKSGLLSDDSCKDSVFMPILKGREPKERAQCIIKPRSTKNWFFKWFQ